MDFRQLWSTNGLFFAIEGQAAPNGLQSRITVPSRRTCFETAAMVEIAGRIGLHLAELTLPIFDHLFIFDRLDQKPLEKKGANPNVYIVVGHDQEWLAQVLQERSHPLLRQLDEIDQEQGILYVSKSEDDTIVVVTGTSGEMTLKAARALVTDSFLDCKMERSFIFFPEEAECPPPMKNEPSNSARGYSLHHLFTTEGLYETNDKELYPTLNAALHVNDSNLQTTTAAVELAARLALSAGYVCFPMTICPKETNGSDRFLISFDIHSDHDETKYELICDPSPSLVIRSGSNHLIETVRELIREWFSPLDIILEDTWRHRFSALQSPSPDVRARAELGMQAFAEITQRKIQRVVIPEHLANPSELWNRWLPKGRFGYSMIEEKPIWTAQWEDKGELAEIETFIDEALGNLEMDAEQEMETTIEVTTTISPSTFEKWAEPFKAAILDQYGIQATFIRRDANKSGLDWAMHEVLPELKQKEGIGTVNVKARAFKPAQKHLDLVHRFLQELYPIDAILASELQLPIDRICLQLDDESAPMFSIAIKDEEGKELGSWSWEGWVRSLPYMPNQPERGNVMIPFAGCRIYKKGENNEIASKSFKTNPYRFWFWYQHDVLPEVIARLGANEGVPKFSRLECHVGMDAADEKLPHLEEVSSVLEALHEDIYFYTLHAFHEHGKRVGDSAWDAPGGILPFMHEEPGGTPNASVALYAMPADHHVAVIDENGKEKWLRPLSPSIQKARIIGLTKKRGRIEFEFDGFMEPYEEQCAEWLKDAAVSTEGGAITCDRGEEKSALDDVFVNEDVERWLAARKEAIPGQVAPIDFSFNGRWIWLVELYSQGRNRNAISSFMKHSLYKPTFFINERHHANEVSSTNAAIQLIDQVAGNDGILNRLNLVIVPLENVDGAALHAEMANEHPCWKLHAARYNACGLEFAKYRFQVDSPFGEARVYEKVWERARPDVVLDDHGVPSHEWIQPFSGYNSPPRFPVSYWIPSARMYTIWRELEGASARHHDAYHSLRSFLTKRLDEDDEVAKGNAQWLSTYRRWGNHFDEQHFPVELSNGSIAYTRRSPVNKHSHDLIERFGEWVTADLMTEVNDETVYGKELNACRHAHHVVHQAIIDWVKERDVRIQVRCDQLKNKAVRIGLERIRPL
ncbi:M14 family metallopeptidase [Fictibacillus gelatini]|uniref:M14 family metallopeptidase n=1 Tax=Fictibacillus gelatini TaxID=225985 RepID=UPI00041DA5D2|nr:M14 family metallopeptidase [Fictibacillus gelatini]